MAKISRWVTLAAGCIVMVSSGLNYSFSLIAPAVKDRFGLSDQQVALLAASINLGGYLAIISGRFYAAVQDRHNLGPRLVMWIGSALMCIGYGGLYLQAAGYITPTLARLITCCVIAGNAGTYWDTSVIVTNVVNFPDDRGSILGILKAFLGLSTSIYATAFWLLYAGQPTPPRTFQPPPPASYPAPPALLTTPPSTWASWLPASLVDLVHKHRKGDTPAVPPAINWLLFVAIVPSTLNLMGSLFINVVPRDYHEPVASPTKQAAGLKAGTSSILASSSRQTGAATPHHHHPADGQGVNKQARLAGLYCLVACLAVLQAAGALLGGGHPDPRIEKVEMWALLGLLSLILLLPASTGPLVRPSLRPKRHRRSHQGGLGTAGAQAAGHSSAAADEEQAATLLTQPLLTQYETQPGQEKAGAAAPALRLPGQPQMVATGPGGVQGGGGGEEDSSSSVSREEGETGPGQDLSVGTALSTGTFWALMASFLSASATGLTYLNNLGAISRALGGQKGGQVAFVSLFSVANAIGRLLFGHVSEAFLHPSSPFPLPRTAFLALAAGLTALTTALLAAGPSLHTLYVLSLLAGLSFGGHWSVLPAIATDLYGLRSFSTLYCLLQLAPAVAAFAFASALAGYVSSHASSEQGVEPGGDCIGLPCFQPTFQALLPLSGVTLGVVAWLVMATRGHYRGRRLSSTQ